jgi:hypothetical protein
VPWGVRTRLLLSQLVLTLVLAAAFAAPASAEPVDFRHGTVDHRFTTTQPGAPSGFSFDAVYHAAGDPDSFPPYMRRMVFHSPRGLRYDTSVPPRCTATDAELALFGTAACPPGSVLGGGRTTTSFNGGPPSEVALDFINNTNEQIILARSPGLATVARGRIHPDQSVEFASPTCFPSLQPLPCPVDTVLQISSTMTVAPYTSDSGSWLTTPPRCPRRGFWRSPVRFWWADGTEDTVIVRNACG